MDSVIGFFFLHTAIFQGQELLLILDDQVSKDIQFSYKRNCEKQKSLKFKELEPMNVWHLFLINVLTQ